MTIKAAAFALQALLLTLLSACIGSEQLLLDPATAVTPVEAGRWQFQEWNEVSQTWGAGETLDVVRSGAGYVVSEGGRDPMAVTLHPLKGSFLIAAAVHDRGDGKKGILYGLVQSSPEGIVSYQTTCGQTPDPVLGRFEFDVAAFGCKARSREGLVGYFNDLTGRTPKPTGRLVPVSP